MLQGLAPKTRDSYRTGVKHFTTFIQNYGLSSHAFPPSANLLIAFCSWLFIRPSRQGGLAASTIIGYLTAVRSFCIDLGVSITAFNDQRLRRIKRGIKRLRSRAPRSRLPITIWLAAKILNIITSADGQTGIMLAAVICSGIYGLFRSSELVPKMYHGLLEGGLRRDHVFWDPQGEWVDIRLDSSKTDYFREGTMVRLHRNGSSTCPVTHLRRAWQAAPNKSPSAFVFQDSKGRHLSYSWLQQSLRTVITRLGLNASLYGTHSLRIGGATSLAMLGERPSVIKQMGRWSSLSYQLYVRVTTVAMRAAALRLGELGDRAMAPDFCIAGKAKGWGKLFGGLSVADAASISADDLEGLAARIRGQRRR